MFASVRQVKLIDTGATQLNSPQQTLVSALPLGNVLAGSTIVVMPTCSNFAGTFVWGANDNKNGAYTAIDITRDPGNASFNSYYKPNSTALVGSDIIQWRFGATANIDGNEDFVGALIIEVAGVTSSPLLAHAINAGSNGVQTLASTTANAITTANLVCGAVPGLLLAASYNCVQNGSAPYVPSVGTGFTDDGTGFVFGAGSTATARVEHLRSASLGTLAATFTAATATSTNFQTLAMAFAESSNSGYLTPTTAAYTSALTGGAMSPAMPSFSAGQLLLLETGANSITLGAPAVTGWTKLSVNSNAPCAALYARIAVGGDTSPSVQWDASHQAYSRITAFGGDVYTDLSTIVDAASNDRGTNATGKIGVLATSTPSQDNCLVIRGGRCLKTATNNGATFNDWLTDAGVYTKVGNTQLVQSGSALAAGMWYWQQTTATATAQDTAALTNADTSANTQGFTVILKSQGTAPAPIRTRSLLGVGS